MKTITAFVLIALRCWSVNGLTVPHGCESFASLLTKARDVEPRGLHADTLATPNLRTRFLVNLNFTKMFQEMRTAAFNSISRSRPSSMEIHSTCRIGISTTSQQDIDFVRSMKQHNYTICKICSSIGIDCNTVGFCPSNSVCYRGHSDDRNNFKPSATLNSSMLDYLHPRASSYGCCDTRSSTCRWGTHMVNTAYHTNYTIHTCTGLACNIDQQSHRDTFNSKINTVNGHWSEWGQWGHCSVTCGGGTMDRSRTCTDPAPAGGGHNCSGLSSTTTNCSMNPCPVDGQWSLWGPWSQCSVTCGDGRMVRARTCTNPVPSSVGHDCLGLSRAMKTCSMEHCAVDGQWSLWGPWSHCSVTCGGGTRSKSRTCNNPPPSSGGLDCTGSSSMISDCGVDHCIVNGHWSLWGSWSDCSVTCDGGTMRRNRTCTDPAPSGGGQNCTGLSRETSTCGLQKCPEWSRWFYDACSVTCGSGTVMRLRHCSSGNDADCAGPTFETVTCNNSHCPAKTPCQGCSWKILITENGGWGTWTSWGTCSATCGDGHQTRSRLCDSPIPQYGGLDCPGEINQTSICRLIDCPHWLPYEEVSSCSVSCGQGFIQLKRNCSTGIQSDCTGSAYDEKICTLQECL